MLVEFQGNLCFNELLTFPYSETSHSEQPRLVNTSK